MKYYKSFLDVNIPEVLLTFTDKTIKDEPGCGGPHLESQHLGDKDRRISVSSRPA